MDETSPFYRPVEPRNAHELLKWTIFDLLRVKKFKKTLSGKKQVAWFLKAYIWSFLWIIFLFVSIYLLEILLITGAGLPNRFPDIFSCELTAQWQNSSEFFTNFRLCIFFATKGLIESSFVTRDLAIFFGVIIFVSGLAAGVIQGVVERSDRGIAFGFTRGLAFVWTAGLAANSIILLIIGLIFSLAMVLAVLITGLVKVLAVGLALIFGLISGLSFALLSVGLDNILSLGRELILGLTMALIFGLGFDYSVGLALGTGWFAGYFRLIFYPFHLAISLFRCCLTDNVFLGDGLIRIPLPSVKKKLMEDAWQKPELAFDFADFLMEYRPFQKKLAFHILHTATAAAWFQSPLTAEILFPPPLVVNTEEERLLKFLPPANWIEHLENLRRELIHAQIQNSECPKEEEWNSFHKSLLEFEKLTLLQPDLWKGDYLRAIRQWITESEKHSSLVVIGKMQ